MPINPNIALGVQQQQPVNMLGQLGQIYALKGAKQEFEGNEALREAYAQGGDLNDPAFRQRVMAANPKLGSQLIKTSAETSKLQNEAIAKRIELSREMLTGINTPEDYLAWHESNHRDPVLGSYLSQRGVTAEDSRAKIMAELGKPGGLERLKRESALGAGKLQQELMQTERSVQVANIGAAAPLGQLQLARDKDARSQEELNRIRGILTGGATPPSAPPAISSAPMGGGGRLGSGTFGVPMGGSGVTQPNVLASQVAPPVTTSAPVNALLNPPAGQTGVAPAMNRVDEITQQLTQLARVGGPVANQAMEGLVKEYNILNPAGKIELGQDGVLRTINERTGVAKVVTGADGQPVMGKVAPVTKDIVDPTDPSGKRMITVEVNSYKAGTGLGADGNQPAPAGVLGVATSQIPANYMRDPNNPQGVIPVPGSAADPNAAVPSGYRPTPTGFEPIPGGPKDPNAVVPPNYRRTADGQGLEFIPGGPADPAVQAQQATGKLDAKTLAIREAAYPKVTSALKAFEAKTTQFDKIITELIDNKKGLDEITGFLAGRTDLSAMSDAGRRALSLFNTVTAKGGFSELQDMRNASPTGGALGNVSNQEGKQLIDSFGALSRTQSGNDLRKSLATAKSDLENLKTRMREAYDMTYEYRAGRAPSSGGGGAPSSGGVIDFGSLK